MDIQVTENFNKGSRTQRIKEGPALCVLCSFESLNLCTTNPQNLVFRARFSYAEQEREYETNENNETDESSNGISFVTLFSFVSYSLFISLVAALPRWVEIFRHILSIQKKNFCERVVV
jgi:hypothetical protein